MLSSRFAARLYAPLLATTRTTVRPPRLTRSMGRVPGGAEENNLNENPADDLGGPGGQELYPISRTLHKRYASITAAGVMLSGAIMYIAKRLQWTTDPNVKYVLVHDSSKGELDDVMRVPVRVKAEDARKPH
ncbi:hypothetical protein OQA88_7075 [Cercophora sp. LCS_1]